MAEHQAIIRERDAQTKERLAADEERIAQQKMRDETRQRIAEAHREQHRIMTMKSLPDFLVCKRKKILGWLSPGSFSEMHEVLQMKRVANTGQWLLEDSKFQDWVSGSESRVLHCVGISITIIQVV